MAKRILLTEPHIYRPGGPEDTGIETCRDCHQSFTTSWLHTDQALRLMDRVRQAEAEAERLREDSDKLTALKAAGVDNWDGYGEAMALLDGEEAGP